MGMYNSARRLLNEPNLLTLKEGLGGGALGGGSSTTIMYVEVTGSWGLYT